MYRSDVSKCLISASCWTDLSPIWPFLDTAQRKVRNIWYWHWHQSFFFFFFFQWKNLPSLDLTVRALHLTAFAIQTSKRSRFRCTLSHSEKVRKIQLQRFFCTHLPFTICPFVWKDSDFLKLLLYALCLEITHSLCVLEGRCIFTWSCTCGCRHPWKPVRVWQCRERNSMPACIDRIYTCVCWECKMHTSKQSSWIPEKRKECWWWW